MNHDEAVERLTERIVSSVPSIVVLGVGIPGSGKSTLLRDVAHELDTTVIDVDAIRNRLIRLDWSDGALARLRAAVDSEVSQHIVRGGVALVDEPSCHAKERLENAKRYRSMGAKTLGAVWMNTPLEIAIDRDSQRTGRARVGAETVTSMYRNLQLRYPSRKDGFDWVESIVS